MTKLISHLIKDTKRSKNNIIWSLLHAKWTELTRICAISKISETFDILKMRDVIKRVILLLKTGLYYLA